MHSLWRVFDKKGMTEMSKLSIPVGISNFEKIRNGGFYYIDKTGLIAELVRSSAEVTKQVKKQNLKKQQQKKQKLHDPDVSEKRLA